MRKLVSLGQDLSKQRFIIKTAGSSNGLTKNSDGRKMRKYCDFLFFEGYSQAKRLMRSFKIT